MARVRDALEMCSKGVGGQRFLFEVIPDVLPYGLLSETERGLWARYYEERRQERR
jgi:hypothetical protein